MRMEIKLFTLQMPLFKAKELCRNSVAKRNGECSIPESIEGIQDENICLQTKLP